MELEDTSDWRIVMLKYVHLNDSIILYINGEAKTVNHLHINYRKIKKAFENNDEHLIEDLLDVEELLKNGVYYVYKNNLDILVHYINTNEGISYLLPIKKLFEYNGDKRPKSVLIDELKHYTHIGTFATADEVYNVYPEYLI